jgi:hypothetical protein
VRSNPSPGSAARRSSASSSGAKVARCALHQRLGVLVQAGGERQFEQQLTAHVAHMRHGRPQPGMQQPLASGRDAEQAARRTGVAPFLAARLDQPLPPQGVDGAVHDRRGDRPDPTQLTLRRGRLDEGEGMHRATAE